MLLYAVGRTRYRHQVQGIDPRDVANKHMMLCRLATNPMKIDMATLATV